MQSGPHAGKKNCKPVKHTLKSIRNKKGGGGGENDNNNKKKKQKKELKNAWT